VRRRAVLLLVVLALAPGTSVRAEDPSEAVAGAVSFGTPRPVSVSWTEFVVDVPVEVRPVGIDGTIESVAFSELQLNGIPFEIDPYTAAFDLPRESPVELPRPLRLRAKFANVAPGVLEEALMPSNTLRLTGKAEVAGTFRKWIFSVHKTVEVPIDERGPNPVAEYHPLKLMLAEYHRLERSGWWPPF
jgi:hypothetical protein